MFYETKKNNHGLPHNPFKAIVAPRPIGWISSLSKEGVPNLAPYSYFNAFSSNPDIVGIGSDGKKDSYFNIKETGEFVCNYVSESFTDAMNASSISAPHGVNEFELAGLEGVASQLVKPKRVKGIAAALECKLTDIIELKDADGNGSENQLILGQVVGVYIDDDYIVDGRFDLTKARPITRLGYMDYQRFGEMFELFRPKWRG